jgi:hypothetical protein
MGRNRKLLIIGLAVMAGCGAEARATAVHCRPALPVFCANVHVGCAGRTTLPTQPFTISALGTSAKIDFADGERWIAGTSVSQSGTVYRNQNSNDWIRIDPEGRFSQRVYRPRGPLMAYGTCE